MISGLLHVLVLDSRSLRIFTFCFSFVDNIQPCFLWPMILDFKMVYNIWDIRNFPSWFYLKVPLSISKSLYSYIIHIIVLFTSRREEFAEIMFIFFLWRITFKLTYSSVYFIPKYTKFMFSGRMMRVVELTTDVPSIVFKPTIRF